MRRRCQTGLSLAIGMRVAETVRTRIVVSVLPIHKIVSSVVAVMWLLCRAPIGGWHGTTKRGWGRGPLAPDRLKGAGLRCETYREMMEARNPGRFHTVAGEPGEARAGRLLACCEVLLGGSCPVSASPLSAGLGGVETLGGPNDTVHAVWPVLGVCQCLVARLPQRGLETGSDMLRERFCKR